MSALTFVVHGRPITQGSKTVMQRGGKIWLVDRNDMKTKTLPKDRLKDWRERVAKVAESAMFVRGWKPESGPVELWCSFYFERSDSHWLKSGKLKKGALRCPIGDLDKYVRALGDALSCVVYLDDVQVVGIDARKRFADRGGQSMVDITVVRL